MTLPACQDIGGQEPHRFGFCPIDFYVPSYIIRETTYHDGRVAQHRINQPSAEDLQPGSRPYVVPVNSQGELIEVTAHWKPVTPLCYYPFGFTAGYAWGDNRQAGIQYLDLSRAAQGIIALDDRFGYIDLPKKLALRDAVDMSDYLYDPADEEPDTSIQFTIKKRFDIPTGRMLDD